MICKDCGSDCIYLGDSVIGDKKEGLTREVPLYGCKLCFRVYWKGKEVKKQVIKGCNVNFERPIR